MLGCDYGIGERGGGGAEEGREERGGAAPGMRRGVEGELVTRSPLRGGVDMEKGAGRGASQLPTVQG